MENVEMTAQEIRIMTAVFGDESRMQEGNLLDHQREALKQLRAGVAYLDGKYPGSGLEILTFAPASKFDHGAQFLLQGRNGSTYTLVVMPDAGHFICTDDYYGALIRESYDAYVCGLLAAEGCDAVAYTSFSALLGDEIGANTTVSEFLAAAPKASRVTHLFVRNTMEASAAKQRVQTVIEENKLYGSYVLYFVPSEVFADAETMENNRSSWEYVTFNCFDVG